MKRDILVTPEIAIVRGPMRGHMFGDIFEH